jgi:hypothetical protein
MAKVLRPVTLTWERFPTLTAARARFGHRCCVYVQADRRGHAVRVGMASKGLVARYRRGTGYALDAAMHKSGNCVFVASVTAGLCGLVGATLIYRHGDSLPYNNVGKRVAPTRALELLHEFDAPTFGISK